MEASPEYLSRPQELKTKDVTSLRYAQIDFTLLDQRMGTLQELRNLVTTAHDLGMYVIIDVQGSEFEC